MHILQSKHSKLSEKDSQELLESLNISKSQLPKILSTDPNLPEDCNVGDIIKIERKKQPTTSDLEEEKVSPYYRVVV
ncbi:DNA-directed RNA polymerase subunit H [Candidatus Pacearchaeota archaeon]|nr:DNA-directed RNA polymerase subunit H [Candidatus Pacearchaeota archaeon]